MSKLTDRLSRPLLDLRLSLIDICNFRCTYCMPAEYDYKFLKDRERMSHEEILRLIKIFSDLGAERIRLTGGEPLLRPDLPSIVREITESVSLRDLALTTNAQLLEKHALELKESGLKRVTVSLDALDPDIFHKMSGGRGSLISVIKGIDKALEVGLTPMKLNCVLEKGVNDSQIIPLARFAHERGIVVRFIEFMDVGNKNHWILDRVVSSAEVLKELQKEFDLEALDSAFYGEVASHYNFKDKPGGVGLISSVTQPFCSSCTRGRLSAAGHFYTCLFAGEGVDLLTPMRDGANDSDITSLIVQTWNNRTDRYSEERSEETAGQRKKVEMFHIGG
ncbi:MAG: GTP 3',8-cyclase MoaA [Lentisphaeraceae bacterium]|nr:GTP 3',8-cyclase MoaA [Lentisphaeraceae bacterium]